VSAGYVTGAMFVASVSAIYLLLGSISRSHGGSMTVALSFGPRLSPFRRRCSAMQADIQPRKTKGSKIASIEAMWETEPPPAAFTVFGLPNQAHSTGLMNALRIPWALGLIRRTPSTRRFLKLTETGPTQPGPYFVRTSCLSASRKIAHRSKRRERPSPTRSIHERYRFALLLKQFRPDIENATDA